MSEGVVAYLLVLLAARTPALLADRSLRERLRSNWVPGSRSALDRFEQSLEDADHRVINADPLLRYIMKRFRRNTLLLRWGPVLIGLLAVWRFDASPWVVGPVLGVFVAGNAVLSDLVLAMHGNRADGHRSPREKRLLVPALAVQAALYSAGFATGFSAIAAWSGQPTVPTLGLMAVSVLLLAFGHLPVRHAVRVGRRTRDPIFAAEAPDDSILYLRPFANDQTRIAWPDNIGFLGRPFLQLVLPRFEELVSVALMSEGPLLAIGRPGESLPELGAVRTYWPDDGWQHAIEQTAHRAERVILVAGLTEGIAWEIERLRSWGMLRKALIVIPPVDAPGTHDRVRRLLDDLEISSFDHDSFVPQALCAVGFDESGAALFFTAPARTWYAYYGAIALHRRILRGDLVVD